MTAVVWFRRDLRLTDNPALAAALDSHERIVALYVHAPDEEAPWMPGAASRWWLHHSLTALAGSLRRRGAELHVRRGASVDALLAVAKAANADAVYWSDCVEPALRARDAHVEAALAHRGIAVHRCGTSLLNAPDAIMSGQGTPYRVFTAYWRNARARLLPSPPLAAPGNIPTRSVDGSVALAALDLLPRVRWDAGLAAAWTPGEDGAARRLEALSDRVLHDYAVDRDRPDRDGTSRLSPHLHFGEITARQVTWHLESAVHDDPAGGERLRGASESFLRELGWREFAHQMLFHRPDTPECNLDRRFDAFAWVTPDANVDAWRRGRTGIPIVDAGMRELWHTGWMHNRVRMIVASFLTKNLRVHWSHGARWFWDTLVDADLANNTQGWQWTAGTGADAAPYFRVFNPVVQGERFDPAGEYVQRFVPELRGFDCRHVHCPWTLPDKLARSGYPGPIVDLRLTRAAALAAYDDLRAG